GVFRRADGHWFARTSGEITGSNPATADDAAPGSAVPGLSSLPAPTGTITTDSKGHRIFRLPVDLSTHAGATTPGSAVIRVSDGTSSDAVEAPLYFQTVNAVRPPKDVPGCSNGTITAKASDQYGQPVVGAVVRLTGYASGARTPVSQLAVTDAHDGLTTFT